MEILLSFMVFRHVFQVAQLQLGNYFYVPPQEQCDMLHKCNTGSFGVTGLSAIYWPDLAKPPHENNLVELRGRGSVQLSEKLLLHI